MRRKISKALVLLLSIAMIAAQFVTPTFAVPADSGLCTCDEATRTGELVKRVEATCAYYGYEEYKCDECGKPYIILTAEPTGAHDYVDHSAKEPTCTEIGWDEYVTCNNCDLTTYVEIAALGHDLTHHEAQSATCTEIGWEAYDECGRCDYTTKVEKPALGHTPGAAAEEDRIEATCTVDGHYDVVVRCEVCDSELSRETVTVPATGHKYSKHVIDATCDTATEVTYVCDICGHSFTEPVGEPLAHVVVIDKGYPATCTEPGKTDGMHCSVCNAVIVPQEVINVDPLSHKAEITKPEVKATCKHTGLAAEVKCADCGKLLYAQIETPIDPNNHEDLKHTDAKTATCTEAGWDAYDTCSVCGYTSYSEIPALGHAMENVPAQAATCTEKGWNAYTKCSVCGHIENYVEIPALGHHTENVDLGKVPPTCDEEGYTVKRCDLCGEIFEDDFVDALGHDVVHHEAQEPTCTEIGWDAYDTCSRCDYTTYVQKDALGHDYIAVVTEPTCTEGGYTTHTCSRCPDSYIDTAVDALGHTEVVDSFVAPTFDDTGLTEGKHCSVCGEVTVPQIIISRKQENISFTYEATGINGSANAVNSGFVTLKVYMNVNSDIARLWGADIDVKYSNFLTLLSVDGCIFEQSGSTPLDVANRDCDVKLTQDMGFSRDKTFAKGTYLFATLTFKVDKNSYSEDASFEVITAECAATRDAEVLKNVLVSDFGTGAQIHVNMLGDADNDGKITSADSMSLSKWFANSDLDSYDTIYDMNKDGFIDGDDFALLRGAVVRDDSYLDI